MEPNGRQKTTLYLIRYKPASTCVQTAWRAKPGCIVSTLSLDITGAFDHVSHRRLLWILERKGFPGWTLRFVASFLSERRTQLIFPGYNSG